MGYSLKYLYKCEKKFITKKFFSVFIIETNTNTNGKENRNLYQAKRIREGSNRNPSKDARQNRKRIFKKNRIKMNHNLESNFLFLKSLKSKKHFANLKVNFYSDDDELPYTIMYFKKQSDHYKVRNIRAKQLILTEYNKNNPTTNIILL